MDKASPVEKAERFQRLAGYFKGEADGRWSGAGKDIGQSRPVNELHHDKSCVILGNGKIMELSDVRMPKLDGEPGFSQEAISHLLGGAQVGIEDLDDPSLLE